MEAPLNRIRRKAKAWQHRYLDRFIFIHINKTGGSSVEHALGIPFEHKTALEKIDELGRETWDRKLTFTVVRNPWDKVVSHYHYRVQTNQTSLSDSPVPFSEWVRRAYGERDPRYYDIPRMFMPQVDWCAGASGTILVKRICHFENLAIEFGDVMHELGKDVRLPHVKPSKRGNYRDYYDSETVEIVRACFAKDISAFQYSF